MTEPVVHTCYLEHHQDKKLDLHIGNGWRCEACDFHGTMDEAIKHATENQFVVQS